MARLQKRGLNESRRTLRWQAPSLFEIKVALVIGFLALALTVLRSVGGMDPDEAAARSIADGIGAFAGLLAAAALMAINLSASRWFERHVSARLERVRQRYTATFTELWAAGLLDTDAGTGQRERTPLFSWFFRLIVALAFIAGVAFMLALGWSVDRELLAAGGIEPSGAPLAAVALAGVSGALSFAIFQLPLAVIALQAYRLDRALDELGRSLARDEPGVPERPRASALRWPALIEPVARRLGPISLPVWRYPQPDAR